MIACRERKRYYYMNKLRRIIAVIGLIVIALLYICFFVLAAMGSDISTNMLMSAFAATIVVPVLIYLLQLIGRVKQRYEEDWQTQVEDAQDEAVSSEESEKADTSSEK